MENFWISGTKRVDLPNGLNLVPGMEALDWFWGNCAGFLPSNTMVFRWVFPWTISQNHRCSFWQLMDPFFAKGHLVLKHRRYQAIPTTPSMLVLGGCLAIGIKWGGVHGHRTNQHWICPAKYTRLLQRSSWKSQGPWDYRLTASHLWGLQKHPILGLQKNIQICRGRDSNHELEWPLVNHLVCDTIFYINVKVLAVLARLMDRDVLCLWTHSRKT